LRGARRHFFSGYVLAAAELDAQPFAEVGDGVAADDRVDSREPEDEVVVLAARVCMDAERPRSRPVKVALAFARAQPREVLALHPADPVGVDAELLDPVLPCVRRRRVDREAEAARVA